MKDLLEIIVFLNFILRTTDLYEPWYFSSKKKKKKTLINEKNIPLKLSSCIPVTNMTLHGYNNLIFNEIN